jgi:predicted transcriptional regulator
MQNYVRLTISLDKEIDKALRDLAKKEDRQINDEFTHVLKFYLETNYKKKL